MSNIKIIFILIKKHRIKISITYLLFTIEMLALLFRPFFLGKAINELFHKNYLGILLLVTSHLIYLLIGGIRHMYDTRTYTQIYTDIVTRFFQFDNSINKVSKRSAHSNLAKEFVDFLEHDLVFVVEAFFNIFGAIIFLFYFNNEIALISIFILFPVIIISKNYGRKLLKLNENKNNQLESEINYLVQNDISKIKEHYKLLRFWFIKISDKEAINFVLMEIIVLIFIMISLYVIYKSETIINPGEIISIFFYIEKFAKGIETIPYTFGRLSALEDIIYRLEFEKKIDS